MGKVSTALIIKFVMTFVAAWIAISLIAGNSWTWALLAGILGTVVNYIVGDRYILPNFGNVVAAIADGILGAVLLFLMDLASTALRLNTTAVLVFGLILIVGEYFFHQYLINSGIVDAKRARS